MRKAQIAKGRGAQAGDFGARPRNVGPTAAQRNDAVDLLTTAVLQLLVTGRIPAGRPPTPAPLPEPTAVHGGSA